MSKDFIKDIVPGDYKTRGSYTPAKKIDLGNHYLIFVSGVQAPKNDDHSVVTDDVEADGLYKAFDKLDLLQ